MKQNSLYSIIVLSVFALYSCVDQWNKDIKVDDQYRSQTLIEILSSKPETSTFASILKITHYDELLSGDKLVTVFAPENKALEALDLTDEASLTEFVKNHIAYLSYPVGSDAFSKDTIEMVNGKRVPTSGKTIGGVSLLSGNGESNIVAKNGILHVIQDIIPQKENIWEYLQDHTSHAQVQYIQSLSKRIMDTEKSIQIGLNSLHQPVYDTVWVENNPFLDKYQLANEGANSTFILLENKVLDTLSVKYAKYFTRLTTAEQDSLVRWEITSDCVLSPVTIDSNGRFLSRDGVLIDIDPANIVETYHASNGTVYRVSQANIKIYENKVKTIVLEAENYTSLYADGDAWSKRSRSWASGGFDMMLNARTTYWVKYTNATGVQSIATFNVHGFATQSANLSATSGYMGAVSNCYIEYQPTLNSVAYRIYWAAYDDISWHYDGTYTAGSAYWQPAKFTQKLLVSYPDKAKVVRNSGGTISNNFDANTVFASSSWFTAGKYEEKQLLRYKVSTVTANVGYAMLSVNDNSTNDNNYYNKYVQYDVNGDQTRIIIPRYGKTTVMVANTTDYKDAYSGMIFLDYIKFVPVVSVDD